MTSANVPCQTARAQLIPYFARTLSLDALTELVGHLDACAQCASVFTQYGHQFGLVRETFAEHLDVEGALEQALPRSVNPLAHPVDVLFLAMGAQHAGRLLATQAPGRARFRGGAGPTMAPAATAVLGPAQLSVSVSGDEPARVVLRYWGDDTPQRVTAKLRWSDATTTDLDLVRGDTATVNAPLGAWLEVLRLET